MITQCSIRHLYTATAETPAIKSGWIDTAKQMERRRCGHHELPEPLSTLGCLSDVVDPKSSGTNKHRYCVASQEQEVRQKMRSIAGVPLVYINRSVMIMEPMAAATSNVREQDERDKVRAGLKGRRGPSGVEAGVGDKRKRDDDDEDEEEVDGAAGRAMRSGLPAGAQAQGKPQTKKRKGPKGPNPLSVKKSKKPETQAAAVEGEKKAIRNAAKKDPQAEEKALDGAIAVDSAVTVDGDGDGQAKKKRRRKHKSGVDAAEGAVDTPTEGGAGGIAVDA